MKEQEAREQLSFIKHVMDDSMGIISEGGAYYILWGTLVVLATLSSYWLTAAALGNLTVWIWVGVWLLGAAGVLLLRRLRRPQGPKTLARRVYISIWTAVGICGAVYAGCAIGTGKMSLDASLSLVAGLLGVAYFIVARLCANPWMLALSFGWWAGTAAFFIIPPRSGPLLLAALVFILELVPGIALTARRRGRT